MAASLEMKGLEGLRVPDGWLVAHFEIRDAARTDRDVPLSAIATMRLLAIRQALLPKATQSIAAVCAQ